MSGAATGLAPELRRVHLIGIGGAGMSGIARILLARGAEVSGSDAKDSRAVLALRALGARIAVGHAPEHLDQLGAPPTVVVSSAIKDTNPELSAARAGGLTVLHRSHALAALMDGHVAACVAGTHGKTSTTSMLTVALQHCGMDPSFAIGGDLTEAGSGAHHGAGRVFVAEADESDGSFLAFTPTVAIVTNVEPDHLDHHGTAEAYVAVFDEFTGRITPGGVLVACADDPGAAALADRAEAAGTRVLRYGAAGPDARILSYAADAHGSECEVELAATVGERPTTGAVVAAATAATSMPSAEWAASAEAGERAPRRVRLRIAAPGEHMARNAVAALVAGCELGGDVACLLDGLASFQGVRRRFEFKGNAAGVRVYDDYAHHPTEVEATLRAARPVAAGGRVIAAFQPHLYSRTRIFAAEFGRALALADEVVVLDVYGAREEPEPGVNGALVVDAIRAAAPDAAARHEPQWSTVPVVLADVARPGDIVVLMGAGDITVLAAELVAELDRRASGTADGAGTRGVPPTGSAAPA